MELLEDIVPLARRYRAVLVDQWGVLHDGERAVPGAREALEVLLDAGARVVLLSNSGRRAATNRRRLEELGFAVDRLTGIVTSGEAAWRFLRDRPGRPWTELGRRCVFLTMAGDLGPVEGLDLELVDDIDRADFLFVSGLDGRSAEAWRSLAEAARARDLPMLCSNPDKVAPSPTGFVDSPGLLAAIYEEMGGRVIYVGKPHAPIYRACLALLPGIEPAEILAIGDSIEHDIKGAAAQGMATCLVASGIHAAEIGPGLGASERAAGLERLCRRYGARPDFLLAAFRC
ncbi:MAG: TIGR01459 family HAD-type hydrolase [Geminicoccaceae bacterium]|nr:TIGR01459 family HAD-type hydrolase [Geminicoccaceae bacterium]